MQREINLTMNNILYKYECRFYYFAWICGITYSVYKLSLIDTYFSSYHDIYADFAPGWFWIKRNQDVSDLEWKIWIPMIVQLIPWLFVHHFVSHIIKAVSSSTLLCSWYILMSTCFLCYYLGVFGTLCILLQPTLLFILTYKRKKSMTWITHILFLFVIHFLKTPDGVFQDTFRFTDEKHYILTLTMCWIQLRSLSYNIDYLSNYSNNNLGEIFHFAQCYLWKLAYCLYLPTLSLGPLILYHEFVESINKPFKPWDMKRLTFSVLNLARYTFWIYFVNLSLHFIYFNAVQFHPEIVQDLNPWALYGLGYCMGQFFLTKYVVIYGLNGHLCKIDDIKAPPQPKCIARIHLYSDMWKYFDRGLYNFLVRYIYTPILNLDCNKLFASFLCFGFVFLWHGMQTNIFVWAFLNFVGVTIESIARTVGKNKKYFTLQRKWLSPDSTRRFHCMLASPLLAMSAISNFYFFAGQEIGDIYVHRVLHESWKTLCILLFFLYCCCQVSIDVRNWELQKADQ